MAIALLLLYFIQISYVSLHEDDSFKSEILQNARCFGQDILSREACSEGYANKTTCLTKKCCWDETDANGFKCFRPRNLMIKNQCNVPYSERLSCTKEDRHGDYRKVSKENCIKKGCCYDEFSSYQFLVRNSMRKYSRAVTNIDFEDEHQLKMDLMNYIAKNPIPQCYVRKIFNDGRCAVPTDERKPCRGSHGKATYDDCINYGCCPRKISDKGIHCFEKDYQYDSNIDCRVDVMHRAVHVDYRYRDNELACLSTGSCFLPPTVCYFSLSKQAQYEKEMEFKRQTALKGVPIKSKDVFLPKSSNPKEFCWTSSYGRGIGLIPSECAELDKQGLLCYPKCKSGYRGILFLCWQDCPSGFKDNGAFCLKPSPYGRGFGYPWKFGDKFNEIGMHSRCMADNPRLGCEKWGLVYYPKCEKGYHNVGCCICSPDCKEDQVDIGISCAKKTYVRKSILPTCAAHQEYNMGLCYKKCKKGFNGLGPICWGSCPAETPFNCGLGCAKDHKTCDDNLFGQIASALELVATIASAVPTAGTSLAASTAVKTSAKIASKAALRKTTRLVTKEGIKKTMKLALKEVGEHVGEVAISEVGYEVLEYVASDNQLEWQDFDPTSIVNVVRYYNHPVCSFD